MKTTERFARALKALVKAFFNDTLAKGRCTACAVGNICGTDEWRYLGFTDNFGTQYKYTHMYFGELINSTDSQLLRSLNAISKTGYTKDEILRIENVFENNTHIYYNLYYQFSKKEIMEDQYNGLMAVVEELCKMDGLDSETYKKAFDYKEDLSPVNA